MCLGKNSIEKYEKFAFFISENADRYNEYADINPDMGADEVVWRVNNKLDKERYTFIEEILNVDDICVLVNKYFKLPDTFVPHELVESDGFLMRKEVAESFTLMRDEALKEGYCLEIVSAYRSIQEQKQIYEEKLLKDKAEFIDESCARPGHSEHHTGLAIDVVWPVPENMELSQTPETAWVRENGPRFGFIVRYLPETVEITGYTSEPWHMRYIGKEKAIDMKEKNIKTLEEYTERYLKKQK
ncbi:MAG: M15 family metallopeptidase [Clostridia bacterium]|nr:M15 family metallopeptidase [Clostridia bacterium]